MRAVSIALSATFVLALPAGILAQTRVDSKLSGIPTPRDFRIEWLQEDVLKADDHKTFVVFNVSIDPSGVGSGGLSVFWRVTGTGANAPAAQEQVTSLSATAATTPALVSRSFIVPAGTYDVAVAAREPAASGKSAAPPKLSWVTRTVTVPDFWNGELGTSSVILAQRIDALPAPLSAAQQADRPYAIGTMELVPAPGARFSRKSDLETFFLIYNLGVDEAKKPDVTVEYTFYAASGGTTVFAATRPVALNAQTVPRFDTLAGDQLQAGRVVPLASFPAGDYRLEIRITDKIANKSLTRAVNFTVTAP